MGGTPLLHSSREGLGAQDTPPTAGTALWLVGSSLVLGIFAERVWMRSTKYAVGHKLGFYYRATGTTFQDESGQRPGRQ